MDKNGYIVGRTDFEYSPTSYFSEFTVTVDTKKMDMGVGEYTIQFWTEYYSLSCWYESPAKYTRKLKFESYINKVADRVNLKV